MTQNHKTNNEGIAQDIIMKHYFAGFEQAPQVVEEMNDIIEALDKKDKQLKIAVDAMNNLQSICSKPGMEDPFKNGWKWFYKIQEALEDLKEEG